MKRLSDRTLVMQYVQNKDNQCLAHLYCRHRAWVYRTCMSYCKDPDEANDLTQEIFIRLIYKLDSFSEKSSFTTWLWAVTTNYCALQLRREQRNRTMKQHYLRDYDTHLINNQDASFAASMLMEHVMSLLPDHQRDLLCTKYCDGVSVETIAIDQRSTIGSVKMRLQRARDRARQLYRHAQGQYYSE
ncbi:RNA polymerase sigma factor [Spirosoma aerolatum]|uniref:RNA polymerase sigma factor n=1 Tax=Spirosoma aerolatum TaxID=1211326 RepID=UPI0009AD0FDD|nr:sigma-70 family RNA polymerase sigma factor [Spirosoma aerolatum]